MRGANTGCECDQLIIVLMPLSRSIPLQCQVWGVCPVLCALTKTHMDTDRQTRTHTYTHTHTRARARSDVNAPVYV